jgi:hypothetical protein
MSKGVQSEIDLIIANDAGHKAELREAIEKGRAVKWQEFARMTGTSERSIRKAWMDKALPTIPGGCIPLREGILALCALPRCLRRNSAPEWIAEFRDLASSLVMPKPKKRKTKERGERAAEPVPAPDVPVQAAPALAADDDEADGLDPMKQAKLENLRAQTLKTKVASEAKAFELSIKRGEYIRVQDVEIDAAQCAVNVISALRAMPARCAGACVGLSAREIQTVLMNELSAVVEQLRSSLFTSGADLDGGEA